MHAAAHDETLKTSLLAMVRLSVLLAALVAAAAAAGAATLRVGLDGGASSAPELVGSCSPSCTVDVYLDLDDASLPAADREASVFQADFDIAMAGAWNVSLDLGEVDPDVDPVAVGTWPGAVGSLTAVRVSVSLTSDNLGGERLVLQLQLTPPASPQPTDQLELFLGSDPGRLLIARDDTGGVVPVALTDPALGSRLVFLPEPASDAMLFAGAAGLGGLAALRRRRRA